MLFYYHRIVRFRTPQKSFTNQNSTLHYHVQCKKNKHGRVDEQVQSTDIRIRKKQPIKNYFGFARIKKCIMLNVV